MPSTPSRTRRLIEAFRALHRRNSDEWIRRIEAPGRQRDPLYGPDRLR